MSASLTARSLRATSACILGLRALAMQYTVMTPVPAASPIDSYVPPAARSFRTCSRTGWALIRLMIRPPAQTDHVAPHGAAASPNSLALVAKCCTCRRFVLAPAGAGRPLSQVK